MNDVADLNLAKDKKPGTRLDTGGIDTPVASAQEVNSAACDRRRAHGEVVRDGWSFWRSSNAFSIQILLARSRDIRPSPLRHSVSSFECICSIIMLHFMKSVLRPFRAVTYLLGIPERPKGRESRLLRRHLTLTQISAAPSGPPRPPRASVNCIPGPRNGGFYGSRSERSETHHLESRRRATNVEACDSLAKRRQPYESCEGWHDPEVTNLHGGRRRYCQPQASVMQFSGRFFLTEKNRRLGGERVTKFGTVRGRSWSACTPLDLHRKAC